MASSSHPRDSRLPAVLTALRLPPPPTPVQVAPWLVLKRLHEEGEVPEGASFMLAPVAPPRLTTFTISRSMLLGDTSGSPFIVASDQCGRRFLVAIGGPCPASGLAALQQDGDSPMLGLPSSSTPRADPSSSQPTAAEAASSSSGIAPHLPPATQRQFLVCDVCTNTALWVRTDGVDIGDGDNVGILSAPGGEIFVVAELRFDATLTNIPVATCTLRRYCSSTSLWTRTVLAHPQPARPDGSNGVFADGERIWWVNLASGVYTLNPFINEPVLQFIPLPIGYTRQANSISLEKSRWIGISNGCLTFLVITHDSVKLWVLRYADSGAYWRHKYTVTMDNIWGDSNYRASGLLESIPAVGLVNPYEPYLVYLYIDRHILCVNLSDKKVTEILVEGLSVPGFSSRFVIVWTFEPQLRLFSAMPEQRMVFVVWQYLQRLQALTQDGEASFTLGVHLSNIGEEMIRLNNGLTATSAYINEVIPYLEIFGTALGDGPVAAFVQTSVALLKCISELTKKSTSAIAFTARACQIIGIHLQQRHPTTQTGGRQRISIVPIVTVRNVEHANDLINQWRDTNDLVVADVEEDLGSEEAKRIFKIFQRAGAFDLIRDSRVLLEKVQDVDDLDWLIV